MLTFILYSRSYCHLCDDMLHALKQYQDSYSFSIEVIDVDANPDLVEQFDELVPVLFGQREGQPSVRLCHYFLDAAELERFLNQ